MTKRDVFYNVVVTLLGQGVPAGQAIILANQVVAAWEKL
jgi:hypothetical protein